MLGFCWFIWCQVYVDCLNKDGLKKICNEVLQLLINCEILFCRYRKFCIMVQLKICLNRKKIYLWIHILTQFSTNKMSNVPNFSIRKQTQYQYFILVNWIIQILQILLFIEPTKTVKCFRENALTFNHRTYGGNHYNNRISKCLWKHS